MPTEFLMGQDGEPPYFVRGSSAATADDALALARGKYGCADDDGWEVYEVLMKPLDPVAMKIRGLDLDYDEFWVQCTARSRQAVRWWRIDEAVVPTAQEQPGATGR